MILVINICTNKFHYYEFVKPIEDIFQFNNVDFITIHYKELSHESLKKADRIIICGTSLKDNDFLEDIDDFYWLKDCDKPILGICGGMHILGLVHDGELKKIQEIGLSNISFSEEFFGFQDQIEVYELHNYCVDSNIFNIIARSGKCPQVIVHKTKKIYGVLFHPEVRNKTIIEKFSIDC